MTGTRVRDEKGDKEEDKRPDAAYHRKRKKSHKPVEALGDLVNGSDNIGGFSKKKS